MAEDTRRILTVTQVNEYMKTLIEAQPNLRSLYIKGEISNFTNHYKTGHFYFTLKDEGGLLRSVMFKFSAEKLKFVPEMERIVFTYNRNVTKSFHKAKNPLQLFDKGSIMKKI